MFLWNIPNKTAGQQPQWQHLLGTIIACQWSTTMCQRTMSSTTQSESASKTFTPVPKTTTAQEAAIWGVSKAGSWTCKTSSQSSHEHEHTPCQVRQDMIFSSRDCLPSHFSFCRIALHFRASPCLLEKITSVRKVLELMSDREFKNRTDVNEVGLSPVLFAFFAPSLWKVGFW